MVHPLLTMLCALTAACSLAPAPLAASAQACYGCGPSVHPIALLTAPAFIASQTVMLFCRYVGASEENVRKLFEEAEADQQRNGDAAELHGIIFDEIDAICKSRGSVRDGSGDGACTAAPVMLCCCCEGSQHCERPACTAGVTL